MKKRIFLAQLICYSGDGVLYTRIYETSNPDVADHIQEIFDADLEKDDWIGGGFCSVITEMTDLIDNLDKDLRRINNERFSVRFVNVCKGLNIKTVYSAQMFNWQSLVGKKVRLGNGHPIIVKQGTIDRLVKELNEFR